jgi:tight adherence protein B
MDGMTILLIGGGVVVLALIGVGIYLSMNSERAAMEERLGKYMEDEKPKGREQQGSSALGDWVNTKVEKTSMGARISKALAQADIKFKPGEFVSMMVIVGVGLGGVLWFVGGQQPLSFLIGLIAGFVAPVIYLRTQQGKRLVKFNDQLGDMINLMVNGIRAGYSTMQAMEAVSRELPPPISDEFRRVVQEMQLGVPMERALENLLRRIPSEDLDFVITAINVQREVGGPLAEILDTISYTIRERVRIKGEIRVMTAQVMQSGQLLAAVPFVVFVLLWFINQEYMMEFFNNITCGAISIGAGLVMIGIGYFVMTRIADIEV